MTHFNINTVTNLLSYQLRIVFHVTILCLSLQIIFTDATIVNMVSQPFPNIFIYLFIYCILFHNSSDVSYLRHFCSFRISKTLFWIQMLT